MKVLSKVSEQDKHFHEIECLVWYQEYLYSGADDGHIKVWNKDLKLIKSFRAHDYAIFHMVVDPVNNLLYTCSNDSTIKQWVKNSNSNEDWTFGKVLQGHTEPIRRMCFSNGKLFSGDEIGEVRIWENGELIGVCNFIEEIWDMHVTDGKMIYSVRDKDLFISELTSLGGEKTQWCVRGSLKGRSPLFLNESKRLLYLTDQTGLALQIYDLKNLGEGSIKIPSGKLEGHNMIVNAIVGSNEALYSAGWDKKIISWDLNQLKIKDEVGVEGTVSALVLNENGRIFVAYEGGYICAIE